MRIFWSFFIQLKNIYSQLSQLTGYIFLAPGGPGHVEAAGWRSGSAASDAAGRCAGATASGGMEIDP